MNFADSIRAQATVVMKETQAQCYEIMNDLFTNVVERTPVSHGQYTGEDYHPGLLKNNWFATADDTPSEATTPIFDEGGNDSLLNIASLAEADLFDGGDSVATLTNNLPYAIRAEYVGWPKPAWSGNVGPYAMVQDSITIVASKNKGNLA